MNVRLLIGLAMAVFALVSYFGSRVYNPITDEEQYINITVEQEIALGLQAEPQLITEFGGLDRDDRAQEIVDQVGANLVQSSVAVESPYAETFEFHLLEDDETVNAFALPGGPIFVSDALYDRFTTEGQLAGVLAHEIGHVIARHGAERIARMELSNGLTGAVILATYDPENPRSATPGQIAQVTSALVNMKYSREDELQSDRLGVRIMADAGYDPHSLIDVMLILAEASEGQAPPEFFSTHPNPENRIQEIERAIEEEFPNGVPEDLTP
jgi:predicted Zn-dependent protease